LLGFIIIAIGTNLTLYANLGLNPWGTFHQGVSHITGLTFGVVSQLTGILIIILSLTIKIYPGIGTLFNMYFIGVLIDLFDRMNFIPQTSNLGVRFIYLILGTLLLNYGIYVYISCLLGAGPRDGLLVGLVKITGVSVSVVRPVIEITILLIGIMLGGSYGVGTVINAVGGGYLLNAIFKLHKFNPKKTNQMVITDLFAVKP
jgi:uncharacterized membrane protein YczE